MFRISIRRDSKFVALSKLTDTVIGVRFSQRKCQLSCNRKRTETRYRTIAIFPGPYTFPDKLRGFEQIGLAVGFHREIKRVAQIVST